MTTTKPEVKPEVKNWFGKQSFAMVPESVLFDKRLGGRHLKLLCMLIKHADKDGTCHPGLDCLAEEMGFFDKNDVPDKNLVTKLISHNPEKAPGPGLVELGYVKKLGWKMGRKTQTYQLVIPGLTADELNAPTNRKMSDAEFKAKTEAEKVEREEKAFKSAQERAERANQRNAERANRSDDENEVIEYQGEKYPYEEVAQARVDGDWGDIPRYVVERCGFKYDFN